MRPAIFFDRDGTLNEEVGYAGRAEDFHIYPFAAEAVRRVNSAGWAAVLITNQAGVARGYFSEAAVGELHQLLEAHLAAGGARLDGIYYCPHHPSVEACLCRKPGAGMLLRAAEELGLNLPASWVIGDRHHDIGAAHACGARGMLVATGYGTQAARGEELGMTPEGRAENALAAVEAILG